MNYPKGRPMKKYLTRAEAAQFLTNVIGIPTTRGTLGKWACLGGGPAYQKAGNKALYTAENLESFATEKLGPLVKTTSETE